MNMKRQAAGLRTSRPKVETIEPASVKLQFEVAKDQAIAYMHMLAKIYGYEVKKIT